MLETVAGVFCGIVTGLVPGLHINSFIPLLAGSGGLAGFVVGVVIAHSFFDFFPAIFLGIPDESTALSILPAHRMVLKGKALRAFQLSVFGGLFSSLLVFCFLPFLSCLSGVDLRFSVLVLLLSTTAFMFLSARKKVLTLAVFVLAGVLGLNSLGNPHAILAMFSGFFGASTIAYSLMNTPNIPKQGMAHAPFPGSKPLFFGSLAGMFSGLMPGISSSISGIVVKKVGRVKEDDFLVVLGGANTVYAFMALFAIHIIGKPRSGAGLLLRNQAEPLALIGSVLLALGLSAFLAFSLGGRVVLLFNKLPLRFLNLCSLLFLAGLAFFFNVFPLFVVSACLGFVCIESGVRRSTCMASLLLPAMLYYLA